MGTTRLCLLLRRRRFVLKLISVAFLIVILIGYVFIRHVIDTEKCDNEELRAMLNSVCKSYKHHYVTGSLCRPLCDDNEVHYIKCLNYREGKKIIFATWKDKTVILKAKHLAPEQHEILGYSPGDSSTRHQQQRMPNIDGFMGLVRNSIMSEFGVSDTRTDVDLLSLLWTGSEPINDILVPSSKNDPQNHRKLQEQQHSVMRSLWSLLQQNEYLFLQYYSENPHLPRIYSSCGHVYAMEYAPSTGALDPDILQFTGVSRFDWHERVKIALDLLNVIKSFWGSPIGLPQNRLVLDFGEVLYLCDVKGSNFGIGQDGRVKPIDTDTVFLQSKLESTMYNTGYCNRSEDCDFFDCLGKCDTFMHKCERKANNNNLESVCRKILTKGMENMYTGLLSNPPTEYESRLSSILNDCLRLKGDHLSRSDKIFDQLYALLQESNKYS